MPYRRLPKTDQARLHALQKAVQQAGNAAYNDQAINYRTLTEAQRFLMQYENQVAQEAVFQINLEQILNNIFLVIQIQYLIRESQNFFCL